ncbi:MAG: sugar phosphate isomerase/epimerase [Anaerolineae bacterium]|jgi:sugar phosphate isomerase/epimerase|nr:sugar phosphate isomerase/epimerase [Anaerolineae bacterium]
MQFAIDHRLLAGATLSDQFTLARDLGFSGIQLSFDQHFGDHLSEITAALAQSGLRVSAISMGHTHLIHPEYAVREQALVQMRQAMSAAVDLEAQGVLFKPFYAAGPVLPDLHPYKSSIELEAELLITQLRATLCDLAYALGTELLLQPISHEETHLIRRVEQAALVCKRLDHHPHLKIAANFYHMHREGETIAETLAQHSTLIGYLHATDSGHQLPGQGDLDFHGIGAALTAINYQGWITYECALREQSLEDICTQLPVSLRVWN